MSGFEVLRSLRVSKVKTPILILSGLAGIEDKIGLGFGADDYVTKPFHKDELVARIHAIVRRSKGHAQSVIRIDDLTVDLEAKTVAVNGTHVHLTGKEYQVLELLSLRKGTTLTKEMFLTHLYDGMDEPALKIIDVFICKLRKKLAYASGGKNYIETIWVVAMWRAIPLTKKRSKYPPEHRISVYSALHMGAAQETFERTHNLSLNFMLGSRPRPESRPAQGRHSACSASEAGFRD